MLSIHGALLARSGAVFCVLRELGFILIKYDKICRHRNNCCETKEYAQFPRNRKLSVPCRDTQISPGVGQEVRCENVSKSLSVVSVGSKRQGRVSRFRFGLFE